MCTKIHEIHNVVSLWSCPPTENCIQWTPDEKNRTLNISHYLQSILVNSTYNVTRNETIYTSPNVTRNETIYTSPNVTRNQTIYTSPNVTRNQTIYTSPNITRNESVSEVPSPSRPRPENSVVSPSPMLRLTPSTDEPFDVQRTILEDRSWVHVFWITPLFFLMVCMLKYRARIVPSRIRSIFVPKERYITRSQSWPQISQTTSHRTQSEPVFSQVAI